jgi:hypothetical protein
MLKDFKFLVDLFLNFHGEFTEVKRLVDRFKVLIPISDPRQFSAIFILFVLVQSSN